jgi:hypothetical protein
MENSQSGSRQGGAAFAEGDENIKSRKKREAVSINS